MSQRSRALLYFWGTRWLNARLTSIPASSWEMDHVSWLPLLCCCRAKLRHAARSHRHSWVHKAFLLLKDIGKSDSMAPRQQVLPVPKTVLPSLSHPACLSLPSASSSHYFSSFSRLVLQVIMFFLCNSKTKLVFGAQVSLCYYVLFFPFGNQHHRNLHSRRFWRDFWPLTDWGLITFIMGYIDPEMRQSCDSCVAQTGFGP